MPKKIGIYLSPMCHHAVPGGKAWYEFRVFLKVFWPLLSKYTLVVSDSVALILREISDQIQVESGTEVRWDVERHQNSRHLINRLVAATQDDVERILFFLDPRKLSQEQEALLHLQIAAAEHGQKLHFNWGAARWAQRELWRRNGALGGLEVGPGPSDTIMLVGERARPPFMEFASKHFDEVMRFPQRVLTSDILSILVANPPKRWVPGLLLHLPLERLDIAAMVVKNYYNTSGQQLEGKFCNVVLCAGNRREPTYEMQQFMQVCFDPRFRTNLMVNPQTAEEWIAGLRTSTTGSEIVQ